MQTHFFLQTEDEKQQYLGLANTTEPTFESGVGSGEYGPFDPTDPAKKYWEMGPSKNQWSCGSCWAFAAVGAVEGMMIKVQNQLV